MTTQTVALRRLFRLVNGGTPSAEPDNWGGDVPWATPVDLAKVDGGAIGPTERTLTAAGLASGSRLVTSGSLIVSTRAPIGYVAETEVPMAFNQGCRGLVPSSEAIDVRFVKYQLIARRPDLQSLGNGSTFQELGSDTLGSFPLVHLPADQQRRIADFLDAETARIDAIITAKQQMADGLIASRMDTMRAGVAGEVVSGDRSKASLAWLPELPTHWGMAKLTLLARLGSGHTPSRSRPEWWMNPTIPWITTGEVAQMRSDRIELILETREMISELGMANSSAELHPAGTVVLCRTASAGYSAIMGGPMAVSQDFATWTCGPHLDPRFLLLCLRAMRRDLLERLAMGSTHKTIYMPDIESIRLPVPPMDEQHRLVEWVWSRLRRIDAIVDTLTAQIALLRERRQALITAAVTGEIGV